MLLCSKLNKIFIGHFDPQKIFLIWKIKKFLGDLTNVSAKTATLFTGVRVARHTRPIFSVQKRVLPDDG